MYAVIRSGGKQYRVEPGKTVRIERLEGKVGGKVTFDEVIAVRNDDKKLVSGGDVAKAKVIGKIVAQDRGLQIPQRRARVHPELVGESSPHR